MDRESKASWLLNVGGWLTRCDHALKSHADVLSITERALITHGGRFESYRLKNTADFITPSQSEFFSCGSCWVGLMGLMSASAVTLDFQTYVDLGRAFRCAVLIVVLLSSEVRILILKGFSLAALQVQATLREVSLAEAGMIVLMVGDFLH